MEVQEILSDIQFYDGIYKESAVDAAIEKREEITPYLIEILEDVYAHPYKYLDDPAGYQNYMYAIMLLAYFKESKAHDILLKILSMPGINLGDLFGDTLTEDMPAILVATCNNHIEKIIELAFNKNAYMYVRTAASQAITYLYAEGLVDRDAVINIFKKLISEEQDPDICSSFATDLYDIRPIELQSEINLAYEQERILPECIAQSDFEKMYENKLDDVLKFLQESYEHVKIKDIHKSMSWWACFHTIYDEPLAANSYSSIVDQDAVKLKETKKKSKNKAKRKQVKASKKANRKRKK
ncbi:DUF1186 family protein [Thiotrichales bacterium 19X7-9]|nr:DUF1186 family protein [Thiotrichales bacterium 19X7-9]